MSITREVDSSLPLVFHNSRPAAASRAVKKSVPFTPVRSSGEAEALPGLMSRTRTVPATVPSVIHSSHPLSS